MKLNLIGITLPDFIDNEADVIAMLLQSGIFSRFHIRKIVGNPDIRREKIINLIERIPTQLHPRLSLHDCHDIASEYDCGIHLNSRNPISPIGFKGIMSCSCHSLEEIPHFPTEDYIFLSPIFPSISKPGYTPTFSLSSLKGKIDKRIYALGGVVPSYLPELTEVGFGGAAMLGIIWEEYNRGTLSNLIKQIECFNS